MEYIQYFSILFAQRRFRNPLGAAAYYILLIENFPTNFLKIKNEARKLIAGQFRSNQLYNGRKELLENGFIAKIMPITTLKRDLGREPYLPISPQLVWRDNSIKLNEILSDIEIEHRLKNLKILQEKFIESFGSNGISIDRDNITIFHSSQWMLYHLVHNIQFNKKLSLTLGSLASFQHPYIEYYEDMLKHNIYTRLIYDSGELESKSRLDNILSLKEIYSNLIKVKSSPSFYGTSRKFIYENMAIDGKKILLKNNNTELSYLSTIYLDKEHIARLTQNFENAWENAIDVWSS